MKINIPVQETIKKRNSVRSYEERKLSTKDKEKLMAYADSLTNPFGVKVNFHIIEKDLEAKGEKLGTYGVIKGATTFLGVSVENIEFFSTPLTEQDANEYAVSLEMLRLAPSATNSQPWRVIKKGEVYHFYETHNANAKVEEKLIKKVDVGIGLSHFHQTSLENGLSGKFEKLSLKKISFHGFL